MGNARQPVKVKICGVTRVADALAACEYGADYVGLNFYSKTARCVELAEAIAIRDAVGGKIALVGVFVNPTRAEVAQRLEQVGFDLLQIYSDLPRIREDWPVPVIHPIGFKRAQPGLLPALPARHEGLFLIDQFDPLLYGGTGMAIELEQLRGLDLGRCFVAGGLRPATVAAVAALGPYGVDVASGVESALGIKDHAMLRSFIENAKYA